MKILARIAVQGDSIEGEKISGRSKDIFRDKIYHAFLTFYWILGNSYLNERKRVKKHAFPIG